MTLALASAFLSLFSQQSLDPYYQGFGGPKNDTIIVGWHDELNDIDRWKPLDMENKAFATDPTKGTLFLGLGKVPSNWAYEYQWSGVTQDASVDIAHYPILMARVTQVRGYAHMDIDVINRRGKVVNTLRSSTVNDPGISTIDLSKSLKPARYRLRLRLIVGGANTGCSATYDWVRFATPGDSEFFTKHPEFDHVVMTMSGLR